MLSIYANASLSSLEILTGCVLRDFVFLLLLPRPRRVRLRLALTVATSVPSQNRADTDSRVTWPKGVEGLLWSSICLLFLVVIKLSCKFFFGYIAEVVVVWQL